MLTHNLLGVIFDLDNTLVSSSLNFNNIRETLGCSKDIDLLSFVDSLPDQQSIDAKKALVDYEIKDASNASKLAGADELLALLSKLSIPCAIVTRNCREAALIKLHNNNIDVPILLTREDHKAKPAPDALLHLAKYWNTPSENLLYVGDYLYDLQAAQNAKTMSCLVTYAKALSYADLADVVVDDLIELSDVIEQTYGIITD